ncbi:MAG: pyridoxal phosphate-dependent aminotransferase [SAR202 cluster bacterium]|nr:pyridoxal phosphate-dependent aminotransferase [SAR202 cluster bacterium]
MNLAKRMERLGTETAFEVLAKARKLEQEGKNIVHLEIGEPDFETADHIKNAAIEALNGGFTHYVPSAGILEVRESISKNIYNTRQVNYNPDQIIITPGAKPIMFFTILALAEPDFEVVFPDPGFPIYESMINFCGGKAVPMPLRGNLNYHPDIEELETLINDRTRLLILNSPNNPCGSVLNKEETEAIVALVEKFPNLYVLSDEVYKDIIYTGQHLSVSQYESIKDRVIILDGLSKSYAMTGWRLGYGAFPEELVPHITKLAVNSVSCTSAFSQMALIAALEGDQSGVVSMVEEFSRRREVIVSGLQNINGIKCPNPEGAFYVFADITNTGITSSEFETKSLQEAGVAVLSGTAFGSYGEGFIRLSYANSIENINIAIDRLNNMVNSL